MKYIFLFSQTNLVFRLAELRGIVAALRINFDVSQLNEVNHIFVVEAEGDEVVKALLSRSVLLKAAYEHIVTSESYEHMKDQLTTDPELMMRFDKPEQSFAVKVRPVGRKKGLNCLETARNMCEFLPLDNAPVDLANPLNSFVGLEEYEHEKAEKPMRIYFGRLIGDGRFRLKQDYNLKDRCYIGNTTMDPELSFIQANITAIRKGGLTLDPFVGTGGLIVAAAEFGALVTGTEINYQIALGIGKSARQGVKFLTNESVAGNFEQYKTMDRFLGVLIADASIHEVWSEGCRFDSIVSDPPYGVREKGRKVGKKFRKEHWTLPGSEHDVHFPEKQKYSIEATFIDLCDLAARNLVVGGRISFWFPVILSDYSEACLPAHPALKLIENCEQVLSRKTSRRLLTYQKMRESKSEEKTTTAQNLFENGTFREAVFTSQT